MKSSGEATNASEQSWSEDPKEVVPPAQKDLYYFQLIVFLSSLNEHTYPHRQAGKLQAMLNPTSTALPQ